MAPEDPVGGGPAGRGQVQVAALGVGDQAVGDEPPEHLAGRLGGDPEVAGDLGRRDPAGVVDAGHHPQREQVLLGGGGQVALDRDVGAWPQDTGPSVTTARGPGARAPTTSPTTHATTSTTPRVVRRGSPSAAAPVGGQDEGRRPRPPRAARRPRSPPAPRGAGTSRMSARAQRPGATMTSGSAAPSHVAANRPQPVSSPTSHPMPRAIGSQPMTARTMRPRRPPKRSSVSARAMSAAARAEVGRRRVGRGGRVAVVGRRGVTLARGEGRARRRRPRRRRRGVAPSRRQTPRLRRSIPTTSSSCGSGRPPSRLGSDACGSSGRGRVRLPVASGAASRRPRAGGAPGACLVLRPVLARVGVFLRVERPVRAARRAVPARAAPVGLERTGIGAVVRRRPERRLVPLAPRPPLRPWPGPGRPRGRTAADVRASRCRPVPADGPPRPPCRPAAARQPVGPAGRGPGAPVRPGPGPAGDAGRRCVPRPPGAALRARPP